MNLELDFGSNELDLRRLMRAILDQAIDDYVKLQHPTSRKKKYMQEAFESSVNMFFDETYTFMYLCDDDDDPMDFSEFIHKLMDDDRVEARKIRDHVVTLAKTFWDNKLVNTISIPSTVQYEGHVYQVRHTETAREFGVDFDNKIISINKSLRTTENQENFLLLCLKVVCFHEDIKIPLASLNKLSSSVFKLLKMNSCFIGA